MPNFCILFISLYITSDYPIVSPPELVFPQRLWEKNYLLSLLSSMAPLPKQILVYTWFHVNHLLNLAYLMHPYSVTGLSSSLWARSAELRESRPPIAVVGDGLAEVGFCAGWAHLLKVTTKQKSPSLHLHFLIFLKAMLQESTGQKIPGLEFG